MMTLALIAAAVALTVAAEPPSAPPPRMTVEVDGLDLAAPADAAIFAERARAASLDFCAAHRALATPRHVNTPRVCERSMRSAALAALSPSDRAAFRRAGGVALLHRL